MSLKVYPAGSPLAVSPLYIFICLAQATRVLVSGSGALSIHISKARLRSLPSTYHHYHHNYTTSYLAFTRQTMKERGEGSSFLVQAGDAWPDSEVACIHLLTYVMIP
jgi:hypothetical protein|uniref:Uncharacterized protein n=1 Tax=Picea glauca TaxID=3330 RepID=A0A101M5D4_PICGL|nr:hypothetical protein ABT39_MTgene981 [Picea glauca]